MNTLDKLTLVEILQAGEIYLDQQHIDEDELFEFAQKNFNELKDYTYKLEKGITGRLELNIWSARC